MKSRVVTQFILLSGLALALLLAACGGDAPADPPGDTAVSQPDTAQVATPLPPVPAGAPATAVPPTPIPPTPTPQLAALVNGQPVLLVDYEKELARYEQAQAELGLEAGEGAANYRAIVLDALIERELIAQAAAVQGVAVAPAAVDARLADLRAIVGEEADFAAWLARNQWTEAEFRAALAVEMLTEQMVVAITADVPYDAEQARARYLQVDDPALAASLLEQIRGGADFAALAQQHSLDRVTAQYGGDLGFFARGSLLVPEVETAAFSLQPDQVSEVIAAANPATGQTTYYLVQLIERDPNRALTADLRYQLLQAAFESWLAAQWSQATITRFVNVDQ